MPKFDITIAGTVDGDDPELAYLNKGKVRLGTVDDVRELLSDILAEEMVFETTDIQVSPVEEGLTIGSRASK